jgi:hypothetical protein
MAERVYHTQAYINELKQKQKLITLSQPIIDKYYAEVRAKLKPSVEEVLDNPDENKIRFIISNELSPILKSQTTNFIEKIDKTGDLNAFYKLSKDFIHRIKNVRGLDSSFTYNLWVKYKNELLSADNNVEEEEKKAIPVVQPINAPFGTTARGSPRSKPGRKPKHEPKNQSLIQHLKHSPQFLARQAQNVPVLNLGEGLHGRGILGMPHVSRR